MLVKMIEWYIGINTDFSVSAGKKGKSFKKYLSNKLYEMYIKTYSDGDYNNLWAAVFKSCELFRITALVVSEQLRFNYNESQDINMWDYLIKVKNNHLLGVAKYD